jgi:hypothetical protein|tara:strand:+ start:657 stop:1460 length:804 start_codon:yes stop_codon:yes gene_type:complete
MADIYDLTDTWNNSLTTFSAIKIDVTDTASAAGSRLLDLQVGGAPIFNVQKDGTTTAAAGLRAAGNVHVNSNTASFKFGTGSDLTFYREAADTLSQRRLTNGQAFDIYNTWTDASNYERTGFQWNTNVFDITTEALGTGTNRLLRLTSATGTIEANSLFSSTGYIAPDQGELTIATGAITVTGSYHTVETQAAASTDDLDTISGGADGMVVVLQAANGARDVVIKDGTGNIKSAGDFTMDNTEDTITLIYSGALTGWVEISRSSNGA